VFVSGLTEGNLGGQNAGGEDAFVAKYDAAGALQWTRQLGTVATDRNFGISADGLGNVYISGHTQGNLAAAHAGGVFDAFLAKYDSTGALAWTRQLGSDQPDISYGISADSHGNVFITGTTGGDLGGPTVGANGSFIAKYDATGARQWTRQFSAAGAVYSSGVATDGLGNAYVTGLVYGNLGGPSAGDDDAFVAKYDAAGNLVWTRQFGSATSDWALGVAVGAAGKVYIAGYTYGNLGGPNAGVFDAFVAKLSPIPGDFDDDGDVDGADFVAWQTNFPRANGATLEMGDADGDGDVDGADFVAWQTNFPSAASPAASPVPEPSTCILLLLAAAGLLTGFSRAKLGKCNY
jgi:hypothetical protein